MTYYNEYMRELLNNIIKNGGYKRMLNKDLVNNIVLQLEVTQVTILRTYGVSCGVGYDIAVTVKNKRTNNLFILEVHAVRQSWACVGYLRPDNPQYKYTGSNDVYKDAVHIYWYNDNKQALKEYYNRFTKKELDTIYNKLMGWL